MPINDQAPVFLSMEFVPLKILEPLVEFKADIFVKRNYRF